MADVPIVQQLQQLSLNNQNNISDLLRKALLVATKLKLNDFRRWILSELNGYENFAEIPAYRKVRAELKFKNPVLGLVPIIINDKEVTDSFCDVKLYDPIAN